MAGEDNINQDIRVGLESIQRTQTEIVELERKIIILQKYCISEEESLSVLLTKYIKCREK